MDGYRSPAQPSCAHRFAPPTKQVTTRLQPCGRVMSAPGKPHSSDSKLRRTIPCTDKFFLWRGCHESHLIPLVVSWAARMRSSFGVEPVEVADVCLVGHAALARWPAHQASIASVMAAHALPCGGPCRASLTRAISRTDKLTRVLRLKIQIQKAQPPAGRVPLVGCEVIWLATRISFAPSHASGTGMVTRFSLRMRYGAHVLSNDHFG